LQPVDVSYPMAIAAPVALILAGAILYFATDLRVVGISLDFIWLVPMLAGLAGLVVELVDEGFWSRRRSSR
jgi:hypothetical protein